MSSTTPLPVGVGYGVVVGIGFFFAFLMCGISWVQVSKLLCQIILKEND
jgi:multidrug transporter EmrE-like cation transporter